MGKMIDNEKDWPMVSVSILSFNRREELRTTLSKILNELDYPEKKLEIMVCDNASTDGTPAMLKTEFPSVNHIRMPENIGTPAWNSGFRRGRGKYFLLLAKRNELRDLFVLLFDLVH